MAVRFSAKLSEQVRARVDGGKRWNLWARSRCLGGKPRGWGKHSHMRYRQKTSNKNLGLQILRRGLSFIQALLL